MLTLAANVSAIKKHLAQLPDKILKEFIRAYCAGHQL